MRIVGLVSPEPHFHVRLISCEVSNLEPLISGKWRALRKWHFQYKTFTRKCTFGAKCVQGVIWRDLKLVWNADLNYAPGREIHLFFKENQRFARQSLQNQRFFKGRSEIWTIILRKSLIFQRNIKYFNDISYEIWTAEERGTTEKAI